MLKLVSLVRDGASRPTRFTRKLLLAPTSNFPFAVLPHAPNTLVLGACVATGGHARRFSSPVGSSQSRGILDKLKDKMEERSDRKQKESMSSMYLTMANAEVWNLQSFSADVDSKISSLGWKRFIPGLSGSKQLEEAKSLQKKIHTVMAEVGGDKTSEELSELNEKEKVRKL